MQIMRKPKSWTTGPHSDQEALDMAAILSTKYENAKAAYDKLLQRKLDAAMENSDGGKSRRTRRKSRHARRKSRHAGRKSRHSRK